MKNSIINSEKMSYRKFKDSLKRISRAMSLWFNPDEKVKIMISHARKDEREEVEKDWKQKYNEMIERAEKDKSYALQDKDAKIESLNKTIEEKNQRLLNVEEVFNFCWEQTKANNNLAADLKIQVWRAQKNQTDTYQAINEIVDRAQSYMQNFEKRESRFKELLGWKGV